MKKKILTFMLSLCFILPCAFILSACGEKAKINVNINTFVGYTAGSLKEGVEEIRLVNASNYNSNVYTDFPVISKDIGKEVTKFEVEEGSKLILFMVLEPGYEINNVKIKPDGYNGTAISPEVFNNYDASGSWVYAFNLTSSLNKELWVVFEGAPERRTQTISLAQTNTEYFDQVEEGVGEDVLPASKVLENAKFTLTSKLGAHTQNHFSNISITELREKIDSNETFEIPAGSTLTLKAYTGFEDSDGNIRIINLYQANIYDDTLSYTQSFSSDSSFLETVYYENGTMNFDWTEFTSNDFIYDVGFTVSIYEYGGNNSYKNITSIKASNGKVLLDSVQDFYVTFSEYFNNYHSGIKVEIPITKAEYALISDSTTELVINYNTRYTIADAKAQGMISVDNEENPTLLTITTKNLKLQDSGYLQFDFFYHEDSLKNNPNLKQIELKVDVENGEEGPYEIAEYFKYSDEADGTIAALTYDNSTFNPEDRTVPINYNGYYYKDTTIRVVADVAFTTDKTMAWDGYGEYEGKTFKLIINEVEITLSAVDIKPEEDDTHYQWTIEGTVPTWLVLSDAYNDYGSKIDFTIDTEAFKEATGQDLALIKIDM